MNKVRYNFSRYISKEIYQGDAFELAQKHLLGAYLCSYVNDELTIGRISELEVYIGEYDKACHAWPNKRTLRTEIMYHCGGCAYVFFVYGKYSQFNVVAGPQGKANAILIRSVEPVIGIDVMRRRRQCDDIKKLTTGPGRLCQALGISCKEHNGIDLCGKTIWISAKEKEYSFISRPRIGIDYAEEYRDKPWRFYLEDSLFISKK